jgi:hypothetical protein
MNELNQINKEEMNMNDVREGISAKMHRYTVQGKAYCIAARMVENSVQGPAIDEAFTEGGFTREDAELIKETFRESIAPALRTSGGNLKMLAYEGQEMLDSTDEEIQESIALICDNVMTRTRQEDQEETPTYLNPDEQETVSKLQAELERLDRGNNKEAAILKSKELMVINNTAALRVMNAREPLSPEVEDAFFYCDLSIPMENILGGQKGLSVTLDLAIGSPLYEEVLNLMRKYSEARIIQVSPLQGQDTGLYLGDGKE